ncbi:MAG: polysaccharide biosynthesis C-terminal domain-containing protein [Bacteroidetes bacterium]|nr:polysaccharide biosynthesis C-terminal domain-containing protein [Bacteroidota bacterium]
MLILTSVFIAVSCAAFSTEIISALYGKVDGTNMAQRILLSFNGELSGIQNPAEVALSADIFMYVILNFIPISALYVYGTLLTAAGEMKSLNITAAIGVVINLGGNFLLIPIYGPLGSAIISLLTQSIVCLLQIALATKKFSLHFDWSHLFKNLLTLTIFGASLYLLQQSTIPWPLQITAAICVGFAIAIVTKTIPLPGISKLLKSKTS